MNKNGHHYLVGVVSYGRGCARPEYPGVYSNVYHYLPWINKVVGDRKEQKMEMTTNESQNSIIISSNEIPTIRPVTTTTTTTPPPPPPPPKGLYILILWVLGGVSVVFKKNNFFFIFHCYFIVILPGYQHRVKIDQFSID